MSAPVRFRVRLTPRSSRNEVVGLEADGAVKVRLTAPPVEGAANKMLVRFLAKRLGVRVSSVRIVGGLKSRDKVVEVLEGDEGCWRRLLPAGQEGQSSYA